MPELLTTSTIFEAACEALPAYDIDHHESDLYLRVTATSKALISRFQYKHMVKTFTDQIDGVLWYELPFCYDPSITTREEA